MAKKARGYTVNGVRKALAVNVGGVMKIAAHDDCCCEDNIISDCLSCCYGDSYGSQEKCPKYISITLSDSDQDYPTECSGIIGTFIFEYSVDGDWVYSNSNSGSCTAGDWHVCQMRFAPCYMDDAALVVRVQECSGLGVWGTCTEKYNPCFSVYTGHVYSGSCGASGDTGSCDGGSGILCNSSSPVYNIDWFPCNEFGDPL